MHTDNFEPLLEHIAIRIGLRARASDRAEWARAIKSRMSVHRFHRPHEYLQLLRSQANDIEGEWRWLLPLLTNGESYFLRDEGQFSLLRTHIIPELIEKRKQHKSLRIWSAGCSTGEEPYSLAILVQEIVPPSWNISILGTDVNEDSLQKARRGIYSAWSFRALPPELRERCFHRVAGGFELDIHLRNMVRFERDNLADNARGHHSFTQDMDLILCRNVLIYFQPEAVSRAVDRFASSLRESGYLLTGHAELHHHNTTRLRAQTFPESIAYQRFDGPPVTTEVVSGGRKITTSLSNLVTPKAATKTGNQVRTASKFPLPIAPIKAVTPPVDENAGSVAAKVEEFCHAARIHANAGRHDEAVNCCKAAIAIDPVATDAYFVWAQVALEQGHLDVAKELYKKVIYLAPSHIEAHIELAAMYNLEADTDRARRLLLAALSVLRASPDNGRDAKIEEMANQIERLVNDKDMGSRR